MTTDLLSTWRASPAKQEILAFVERTCGGGSEAVPPEERVAVFDNDGTLWCEKPMPVQLDFIIRRLVEMGVEQPELRQRQPWKAAHERDYGWFGRVMDEHYAGNDADLGTLANGILDAHGHITVEAFEEQADHFLRSARNSTLDRLYLQCVYTPMIELIGCLQANEFSCYIVSGGGRDFIRPVSQEVYAIPRERVIGSSTNLAYAGDKQGGTITRTTEIDVLDDGQEKPVRIWNRTGRRPVLAAGNSNGDIPMLEFAHDGDRPGLRLLILHDDADREFAYTGGAETALQRADTDGWTVVSIANDWTTVFPS